MTTWFHALGDRQAAAELVCGVGENGPEFGRLALIASGLLAVYGVSMGLFNSYLAGAVSAVKLPILYFATLLVCFPAMYVLNHQLGPRLSAQECGRLLVLTLMTNAAGLASYAPVSYFFVFTTSDAGYGFLVGMHVAVFALSGLGSVGVAGMLFHAVCSAKGIPLRWGFILSWAFLYAFVGSQMSWLLRPWFGAVGMEYALLRAKEGSFFEAVWGLITGLIQ